MKKKSEKIKWLYADGLCSYLNESSSDIDLLIDESIVCSKSSDTQEVEFAINWSKNARKDLLNETYVNLIPTSQGGSHFNGFKSGLLEALKEFCEYRNLLPKGLKIVADDVVSN